MKRIFILALVFFCSTAYTKTDEKSAFYIDQDKIDYSPTLNLAFGPVPSAVIVAEATGDLVLKCNDHEIIRIKPNGDCYARKRKITNNKEVYHRFRAVLAAMYGAIQ